MSFVVYFKDLLVWSKHGQDRRRMRSRKKKKTRDNKMESPFSATPKKILFSKWMELKIILFKILNWNLISLFFSLSSNENIDIVLLINVVVVFFENRWEWLRIRMKVSCNDQHTRLVHGGGLLILTFLFPWIQT